MVAHHQHVQMFIQGVDGVGPGRIGGGGQDIRLAHSGDNVRRMAPARAFSVEGVDGTVFECRQRVFQKPGFV